MVTYRKHMQIVQPSVRICFDCGGIVRSFNKNANEINFKKGDLIRIIDSEQYSDSIYKIKKMIKSHDGTKLYLLRSTSRKISLLYYESSYSHLENVEHYPIKGK